LEGGEGGGLVHRGSRWWWWGSRKGGRKGCVAWRRAGEHERKQKGEGVVVWGAQLRRKMGRRIGFRDPIFFKKIDPCTSIFF